MENEKNPVLNDFIQQNQIGKGSFGKVFKVKSKKTEEIFAAKVTLEEHDELTNENLQDLSREVNIISKLNHPSVLKFICYSPVNFKKKPKSVIVTEYAPNGSLDGLIEKSRNSKSKTIFDDTHKAIIIYGIASAMCYLHSHGIIHRDLKPSNVLLDDFLFPKISDFGLSEIIDSKTANENSKSYKGTPIYMSPEIWSKYQYSQASDVYAFSILLYEIITNEIPFENMNFYEILIKVKAGYRPLFTSPINESYKKLIVDCWNEEPSNRPSFKNILERLKNDPGFITKSVNKQQFLSYVNYIDNYKTTLIPVKDIVHYRCNRFKPDSFQLKINEVVINQLYPIMKFRKLDKECQVLVKQAEKDPKKQFIIGQSLVEGWDNFPYDPEVGIKYLKNSYKNGCIDSFIYYFEMWLTGNVIPRNIQKAKKLLSNKFQWTDQEAIYSLLNGKICLEENNYKKAKKFFSDSINKGNIEAIYEYGKMLYNGIGVSEDKKRGIKYFKEAINKDCLHALYEYGMILLKENGPQEGLECIKMAADKGFSGAIYIYYRLLKGIAESNHQIDSNEFQKYMELSAKKGYAYALFNYATYANIPERIPYLEKSAKKGCLDAINILGMIYITGYKKIHIDEEKAIIFLKIAADNGYNEAMARYGRMLVFGKCVEPNAKEGVKYIKHAIEKGNLNAIFFYAYMLQNGQGVSVNKKNGTKIL